MKKKNYEKEELESLREESKDLYKLFADSISWVENHLKYEDRDKLSVKLRKDKAEIKKIENTLQSKPVFALFGVSQVGKSYLVKNLLSENGKALEVVCGDQRYDFLKEINPHGGGAESTGVVTRFSVDSVGLSKDFPIQVKLLNPKDLILILADTFFSDVSGVEGYTSKEELKKILAELKDEYSDKPTVNHHLTEDDIWDISKYFKDNFTKASHYVSDLESVSYWLEISYLIDKVSSNDWFKVFGPLWCNQPELNSLMTKLMACLEQINFVNTVYVQSEAILRNEGAILDVQRLNELMQKSDEIDISLSDSNVKKIEISLLSALTSELTLTVDQDLQNSKAFLESTDLLDFPGARSRENFDFNSIEDDSVVRMYLRGKISYLFNKYSADFEINNLLFCMKDEQLEVTDLSEMINSWIEKNIGFDPESREKTVGNLPSSPLFVVFTFFNRQLDFHPTNDENDLSYKWKNRFNRFFEDQITFKYGWHTRWTESKPHFNNFFLLRDFNFSEDTFDSENGREVKIREERALYMQKLKESFLNYPFVKRHFNDPEKAWDNSASPGHDGSELILNNLCSAANNYVKVNNLMNRLLNKRDVAVQELKKYYVHDNLQGQRDEAFRKAIQIQGALLKLFAKREFRFSEFIRSFCLVDTDVYNLIHENYLNSGRKDEPQQFSILRSMFPGLSDTLSYDENLEVIRIKLKLDTIEEAEDYLNDNEIDLDTVLENRVYTSATKLVDSIINLWNSKLNLENLQEFVVLGMRQSDLELFIENLMITFESLHIRSELVELFEQKTKLLNAPSATQEYLASIATNYINDFVSNFGFNFMGEDRLDELFDICNEYQEDISVLKSDGIAPKMEELVSVYDHSETSKGSGVDPVADNVNLYLMKVKLAMISNCGFARYDVNANQKLNELISGLDAKSANSN